MIFENMEYIDFVNARRRQSMYIRKQRIYWNVDYI